MLATAPCLAGEPTAPQALHELLGVAVAANTVKLPSGKSASLWFEHRFAFGGDDYDAFFVEYPDVDENGSGCHACSARIGAITYRRAGDDWTVAARQPRFAEMGSWGRAPQVDRRSPVAELNLAPDNLALLIADGYTAQGQTDGGKSLLGFRQGAWKWLGFIATDGDNSGMCSHPGGPKDEADWPTCYSFKGAISIVVGSDRDYPELRVRFTGTAPDDSGKIVPAPDALYKFGGDQYQQFGGPKP